VAVRVTKTKVDWAEDMARILEWRYADCEKVIRIEAVHCRETD
jgi:hypothetical protein